MVKRSKDNITFDQLDTKNYNCVILTGGYETPDRVRQDERVKKFVNEMAKQGKVVGGLCHGPWIMISAGIMKGVNACAYPGLKDDMVNPGALVVEADVVTDKNIMTCSYYVESGKFMRAVFDAYKTLLS
ncbi:DJ-1/PfpI family protein [Abyssogena phaseoliformis symbiont]|uniref:DJ-1/PfpI family protein n=1 Tax=Abyssogena phaseoliformis symbiont TaxID=596095 RepID=UPI001CECCA8E|nr:DJ-1/PfpI family protein [Abyssogena phaseoliformis symbiont]